MSDMAQARFNGTVIAESEATIIVEGNHYFPPDSVQRRFFADHDRTSVCGWKGTANYLTVTVDGESAEAAAWYYPDPLDKAAEIKDYLAFYSAITIEA